MGHVLDGATTGVLADEGPQSAPRSRASLHGERTHATRGARDQDRLARLHLRDVAQRLQRGEPRRRQRRGLLHREALAHGHDLHRRRGPGPARRCRVGAVVASKRWGEAGAGCGASRWRTGSSRGSERWAEATNRSGRAYRCCFRISVAPSRTSETWIGPGVRCPRTATNASESAWRRSARCSNPSLSPFELGPRPATAPGRQRGRPRAHEADAPRRPMVQPGTRAAGRWRASLLQRVHGAPAGTRGTYRHTADRSGEPWRRLQAPHPDLPIDSPRRLCRSRCSTGRLDVPRTRARVATASAVDMPHAHVEPTDRRPRHDK